MKKNTLQIIFERGNTLIRTILPKEAKFNFCFIIGILFFAIPLGSLLSSEFIVENTPPNTPSCVSPYNGSFDIHIDSYLRWNGGDPNGDSVMYDIYFGEIFPPPKVATISSTTYNLELLEYETTYYWKISARDSHGDSKISPIFSFTTEMDTSVDEKDDDNQHQHTVFVEFGASVWGENCPQIKKILHELYLSGDYRFNYVTMVYDENDKAKQRLVDEYNIHDFPTTYVDGGYYVLDSSSDTTYDKSDFEDKLSAAELRNTQKILINVDCELKNATDEFETTVSIENNENDTYNGQLRVYLVEKISRWYDYEGSPFQFGFIDYIINEDVTVSADKKYFTSKKLSLSNLDHDNLMVIAVLFNEKPFKKDSNPSNPSHYHGFNAYYADATASVDVANTKNLPPQVGIEYPKKLRINIFGNAKMMTPFWKNTILIGRTTVKAFTLDDSKVEKVEFYIDENLKETVTQEPYEYTFRKTGFIKHLLRRHTITVIAYDDSGKTASASLEVLTIFL